MKKLISFILGILLVAITFSGCSIPESNTGSVTQVPASPIPTVSPATTAPTAPAATPGNIAAADSKVLIVYYSLSGTSENVAKIIEAKTGGTLYLLEPETPYPSSTEAVGTEMQAERDNNSIRELKDTLPDLSDYDTILIGGPVWSGLPSNPVQKYLSMSDFGGKKVSGFWSAYGDPADYANEFKALVDNGDVLEGLSLVNADVSDSAALNTQIDAWLNALDIA